MALWISISPGSSDPIYVQIVSQIEQAIAKGELMVGDKLPPVRKLAVELTINPNTVARAYTVLEQKGLLSSKTGAGTFIANPELRINKDIAKLNVLTERMDNVIAQSLNIGLTDKEIKDMFNNRLDNFLRKEDKND